MMHNTSYASALSEKEDLLQELFQEMQKHLAHFFAELDIGALHQVYEKLMSCSGTIFLTGIGKSGIIAKKVATTMSSCGTKAHFLSPVNALHGDLGVVSTNDCILLLSKSGETDELLELCPALRNKGAFLIAVVSNSKSRLSKACDLSIVLPVQKELCPFDLAPTTSTVVQLLFGDLLAIALMRAKKISLDEYRQNHPAGRIGKRLTLKVEDLMISQQGIPLCKPQDKLLDSLVELSQKKCGAVLISDDHNHLLGIFTDGDLRRALQKHGATALDKSLDQLMTKNPRTVTQEMLAFDALKIMEGNQKSAITVLPVVDERQIVGIIKLHDIVQSGV